MLAALLKAELGPIRLEQAAGERFTGGKSTPVWKLFFTATRGDKTRNTQLVAKWVQPSTDFRRSSYANERQFYANAAATARKSCRLPHLLLSEVSSEGLCFLLDDLSVDFPLHPECLDLRGARAAMLWLARFHASFWEADSAGGSFPAGGCASGGYWGLGHGDNEARLEAVPKSLVASCKALQAHGAWERARTLGPRLAAAALALDAALRGAKGARGFARFRTLLHGDFKTANMFLREAAPGVDFEVAAVDFEFSGPGLVATDLANFLFPDMRIYIYIYTCMSIYLSDLSIDVYIYIYIYIYKDGPAGRGAGAAARLPRVPGGLPRGPGARLRLQPAAAGGALRGGALRLHALHARQGLDGLRRRGRAAAPGRRPRPGPPRWRGAAGPREV